MPVKIFAAIPTQIHSRSAQTAWLGGRRTRPTPLAIHQEAAAFGRESSTSVYQTTCCLSVTAYRWEARSDHHSCGEQYEVLDDELTLNREQQGVAVAERDIGEHSEHQEGAHHLPSEQRERDPQQLVEHQ